MLPIRMDDLFANTVDSGEIGCTFGPEVLYPGSSVSMRLNIQSEELDFHTQ